MPWKLEGRRICWPYQVLVREVSCKRKYWRLSLLYELSQAHAHSAQRLRVVRAPAVLRSVRTLILELMIRQIFFIVWLQIVRCQRAGVFQSGIFSFSVRKYVEAMPTASQMLDLLSVEVPNDIEPTKAVVGRQALYAEVSHPPSPCYPYLTSSSISQR